MVILDTLKYFAQFPSREGVYSMFTNGSSSSFPAYSEVQQYIAALPQARIPDIGGFVFGQSFDHVKRRIDALTGTYLFVDFGEFSSSRDRTNSISDTQKMAATVAMKLTDAADLVEVALATDLTLELTARLRQLLIADTYGDRCPWLNPISDKHDIVPFVSSEFKSVGWTLMFTTTAADLFDVKRRRNE